MQAIDEPVADGVDDGKAGGKVSRTRKHRQEKTQAKGATLTSLSTVQAALACGFAIGDEDPLAPLSSQERAYLAVVQEWRKVRSRVRCACYQRSLPVVFD